jgi:hypothetical protein
MSGKQQKNTDEPNDHLKREHEFIDLETLSIVSWSCVNSSASRVDAPKK